MSTVMNAGLPSAAVSSGLPIGAAMLLQNSASAVTLADKSVWLRAGVLAPASLYPAAAKVESLRAHNFSAISPGGSAGGTVRRIATDGNGRYMIADGDTVNVRMSSDYGATWSNVAHNLGLAATDICYAGGTWLVTANSATALLGASSVNGTSFSGNFTIGSSASLFQAGSAQIAHSGTLFYVAVGGTDASNSFWSSPTGLTGSWTSRSPGVSLGNSGFGLGAGGGKALIVLSGSATAYKGTDGGSFSSTALPSSPATAGRPAYIAGAFLVYLSSAVYFYTTDSTAFAIYNLTPGFTLGHQWAIVGTRLLWPCAGNYGIAYTTDGLNWSYQSTSINAGSALSDGFAADSRTMLYQPTSSATGYRAASSIARSNYVGRSQAAYASSNTFNNPYLYYKVK